MKALFCALAVVVLCGACGPVEGEPVSTEAGSQSEEREEIEPFVPEAAESQDEMDELSQELAGCTQVQQFGSLNSRDCFTPVTFRKAAQRVCRALGREGYEVKWEGRCAGGKYKVHKYRCCYQSA